MSRLTAIVAALLLASPALAVEVPAPKLSLSGSVDGYFLLNVTQSQTDDYGGGVVGNPTLAPGYATGFNLGTARLGAKAESGPVTLVLDLAYGPAGMFETGASTGLSMFVEQAFASMKFGKLTVDAGRFVTPVGLESAVAKDNWLYSHGLLYTFARPVGHVGARVSMALSPELSGYAFVANGGDLKTNDDGFTGSPYKTAAVGGRYTKDGMVFAGNLLVSKDPGVGPVPGADSYLLDVGFLKEVGPTSFSVNGDLGSYDGSTYFGIGAAVKHALEQDGLKVVGRAEFFSDDDAVRAPFLVGTSGPGGSLFSLAGGVNYPVGKNAELRAELRFDHASEKVYKPTDPSNSILTFTASALAWF